MEYHHLHLQTSPRSTISCSSISKNNGVTSAAAPSPPPLTPRSIDANPCPATFIHADTSSFKQVVQMLTGSVETATKHVASAGEPPKNSPRAPPKVGTKRPSFKLYERRGSFKSLKMMGPPMPALLGSNPISGGTSSPRKQRTEIMSPSVLDFPSLVLSPVTPLIPDPFNRSPHPNSAAAMSAEDRAIAGKGFYLHPSPRTMPRLLPLFPVTSPRVSSSSAAGSST